MRILVATRIAKSEMEAIEGRAALNYLMGQGHGAIHDEALDWEGDDEETKEEIYRERMASFDGVLLVEDDGYRIGRGQFFLATIALEDGKGAWIWRGGRGVPIRYLRERDTDNWQKGYGEVIV
jgi:hypothetical protein